MPELHLHSQIITRPPTQWMTRSHSNHMQDLRARDSWLSGDDKMQDGSQHKAAAIDEMAALAEQNMFVAAAKAGSLQEYRAESRVVQGSAVLNVM